ncbi:hypothetical protein GPX89_30450 [Nocardia sp. ET3-3]|uniref:Uncharacterized protein n=1 Tax=Nocardia terrae TaxID=2675851 RepID=A0A7K1V527_9NOCA|nr:hypothetical protein [Nocardia terrae]MVU81549.1 hypothetical protein [Nocardia terrae]
MLVKLVLGKHKPRSGDTVIVQVFPPRIEIRSGKEGDQDNRRTTQDEDGSPRAGHKVDLEPDAAQGS